MNTFFHQIENLQTTFYQPGFTCIYLQVSREMSKVHKTNYMSAYAQVITFHCMALQFIVCCHLLVKGLVFKDIN